MYLDNKDVITITLMNENYIHPARPKTATKDAILKGAYLYKTDSKPDINLGHSGVTLNLPLKLAVFLRN